MHWFDKIMDGIFPETCAHCGRSGSALCAICERTIVTKARAVGPKTAALFEYRNPVVREAIRTMKYRRRKGLAVYFGTALYREFFRPLARKTPRSTERIVLVPIPPSEEGTLERGFRPTVVIAETIAALAQEEGLSLEVLSDLLLPSRTHTPQARMKTRAEREENADGAFRTTNVERIAGATVIIIDDVITTGATLREARRELAPGKPKKVLAIAAAH